MMAAVRNEKTPLSIPISIGNGAATYRTVLANRGLEDPFRVAAVIMCSIFFVGMIALIWAPETKGKPLPED